MIPEIIKETDDLRSQSDSFGDFVLIERRSYKRLSKDDVCVFSNGTICRGSGKSCRIQQQASNAEMVLEITYPNSKGIFFVCFDK